VGALWLGFPVEKKHTTTARASYRNCRDKIKWELDRRKLYFDTELKIMLSNGNFLLCGNFKYRQGLFKLLQT
jgi:hypothetical protein